MTNTMECEGSVYVKDHACRLTLHINESSIAIYDLVSRKHIHEIDLTSVVGAEALSGSSSSNRSILHLYDYGFNDGLSLLSSISCMSSRRHRACHVIELQFADASTCRSWANAINIITSSPVTPTVTSTNVSSWMTSPPPRRKFLVLVNPASGPGNALSIWKDEVQPMLIHACIDVKLVVTQYANHARKLIRETGNANGDELELGVSSLLEFDCIVIVAGDGLVFEVINGIADRYHTPLIVLSIHIFEYTPNTPQKLPLIHPLNSTLSRTSSDPPFPFTNTPPFLTGAMLIRSCLCCPLQQYREAQEMDWQKVSYSSVEKNVLLSTQYL